MANLTLLGTAIDIFYIHKTNKINSNTALSLSIAINSCLNLDWLTQQLNACKPKNHWDFSQKESLQQTLRFQRIKLFQHLLNKHDIKILLNSSQKELLNIISKDFNAQLSLYFKTVKLLKQDKKQP